MFDVCRHPYITIYAEEDGPLRMWACAECGIRFYPACETCISVGHRNEKHEDGPEERIKVLESLVREMIHHECWDGDNYLRKPFYHLWKDSEWEQEDLKTLIGAMFK